MSGRMFGNMMIICGLVGLLIGTGVFTSEKPFYTNCQRGCWLEPMLLVVFGEQWGKRVSVTVWYVAGFFAIGLGLRIRKEAQMQSQNQLTQDDDLKS